MPAPKLRFTFNVDGAEYPVDVMRLMAPEAMELERLTGVSYNAAIAAVGDPDKQGWTVVTLAFYYLARKRKEPTIKWADAIATVEPMQLLEDMTVETDEPTGQEDGETADPTSATDSPASEPVA